MAKGKQTQFDLKEVETRASLGATQHEVATVYNVTQRCFEQNLARNKALRAAWDRGWAAGKIGLRYKLFKLAETNAAAAIFLAKNYLGMRDVVNNEMTGLNGGPIETSDVSAKDRLLDRVNRLATRLGTDEGDHVVN
jgi:hypothetical protein